MTGPERSGRVRLVLKAQEIPFDHPDSRCAFDKQLVATRAALATFGVLPILACHLHLKGLARQHDGLDYLQVFENREDGPNLWFIEDAEVVTALLPEDY
jgi:hypothetical protein